MSSKNKPRKAVAPGISVIAVLPGIRRETGSSERRPALNLTSNADGVSAVFFRNAAFLKRFVVRYLKGDMDVEDVLQEAYLKAYSAEQDKRYIEHPKALLFSIAKNLALNELNRKSRQMTTYIEECQDDPVQQDSCSLEEEIEAEQTIGLYCEAIATLPEECRRVYLLRKVHGLRHAEIAERMNVSLSTVEKHLRLGWLSCRDYMRRQGGEYDLGKRARRVSER